MQSPPQSHPEAELLEFVMDAGRSSEARLSNGLIRPLGRHSVWEAVEALRRTTGGAEGAEGAEGAGLEEGSAAAAQDWCRRDDIWYPQDASSDPAARRQSLDPFRGDNRLGLPGLLHRVSCIRDVKVGGDVLYMWNLSKKSVMYSRYKTLILQVRTAAAGSHSRTRVPFFPTFLPSTSHLYSTPI